MRRPRLAWRRSVAPAVVGAALVLLGRPLAGAIALVAATLLAIPAIGDRIEPVVVRGSRWAGRVVVAALLLAVNVLVVLPCWLIATALRIDVLRARPRHGSTWQPAATRAQSNPARQFVQPDLRSRPSALRTAWSLVGVVVVVLLVDYAIGWAWDATVGDDQREAVVAVGVDIEGAGRTSSTVVEPFDPAAPWPPASSWITPAQAREHFDDVPWGRQLIYETSQRTYVPFPYIGQKPNPLRTTYVNIDGWERRTYEAPGTPADAPEIWLFGGSTTFGLGQRDQETIASEIARRAAEAGLEVRVRNFGQVAFLNWQEMLLFEHLLATEPRAPALAVFYDGVNEFAYPAPFDHPAPRQFDPGSGAVPPASDPSSSWTRGLVDSYLEHSATAKVARQVRGWVDPPAGAAPAQGVGSDEAAEVAATAANYDRGVALIEDLAAANDVEPVFVWQPRLGRQDRHDAIAAAITAPIVDLSDALDGAPETYLDDSHTDERGAELCADAIWQEIEVRVRALTGG